MILQIEKYFMNVNTKKEFINSIANMADKELVEEKSIDYD